MNETREEGNLSCELTNEVNTSSCEHDVALAIEPESDFIPLVVVEAKDVEDLSKPLQLTFSCEHCGLKESTCFVRLRLEDETVETWAREVATPGLDEMHQLMSPGCPNTYIQVIIPYSPKGIGY